VSTFGVWLGQIARGRGNVTHLQARISFYLVGYLLISSLVSNGLSEAERKSLLIPKRLDPIKAIPCKQCGAKARVSCRNGLYRAHSVRNFEYGLLCIHSVDWWYSRITQQWIKEHNNDL